MPSEAPPNYEPVKGLPPVAPPSGKFLIQLFLVPGLIVAIALAVVWGFGWLVGGSYSAEEFLKDLRNPNAEYRWRRANDLAQVLPRDKALASNPKFALDLAELLRQGMEKWVAELERTGGPMPADMRAQRLASDGAALAASVLVERPSLEAALGAMNLPILLWCGDQDPAHERAKRAAHELFAYSIIYLFVLFAALLVDGGMGHGGGAA